MEEEEEEILKRFNCIECGHTFVMECESDEMTPKFCPFCAATVYIDEDEDDNKYYEDDNFPFGD